MTKECYHCRMPRSATETIEERRLRIVLQVNTIGDLLAEVKRLREKEREIIEYVGHLQATPDVLKQLIGSPSQIHTIANLTASLEHLLYILRKGPESSQDFTPRRGVPFRELKKTMMDARFADTEWLEKN